MGKKEDNKDLMWKKFLTTGSVEDYLSYKLAKQMADQEENYNFENKYNRIGRI